MVDNNENKISNEIVIYADKCSEFGQDREFKEKITLKRKTYLKSEKYYLIIKNSKEDIEIERIPFDIDIAIQDDFFF